MKVKVILRAPKSQIPLYMTLNDAKFGNEEVTTSLNVVESDEVVHWVNNTTITSPTNLQIAPQKQLVISEDLARSISNSLSEIFKSNNKANKINENLVRDLKNNSNLSSIRHKYNVFHIKDAFPERRISTELAKKDENEVDAASESINKNEVNAEKDQKIGEIEKLLSQDLDKDYPSQNSGLMGASVGSKYNGKELKSNLRKKYFKSSNSKSKRNEFEYNKKFRSNEDFPEDFHELFPPFNDNTDDTDQFQNSNSDLSQSRNSQEIQKIIQDEIDHASKMESIQCEIVKTFKNLTLSPCLCKPSESSNKPYDRNQVIIQKRLFLNELHERVPLKYSHNYVSPKNDSRNMYLLIHGLGKEAEGSASLKESKSNLESNSVNEFSHLNQGKTSNSPENTNPDETNCHKLNPELKHDNIPEDNTEDKTEEIQNPQVGNENENGLKSKDSNELESQKEDSDLDLELDPKSQLFQALSKISLELSNANSALDQCLNENEDIASSMDGVFIKGLQDKLDHLDLLYKKMQIRINHDDQPENSDPDESQKNEIHLTENFIDFNNDNEIKKVLNEDEDEDEEDNSTKVPDTNLPVLTDMSCQKEDSSNSIAKRPPIHKIIQSYNESHRLQPLSKLESKRSISVPAHENQLLSPQNEKGTKSIGEIPSLNEFQDLSGNKNLSSVGSFSSINSNHYINNKPPLSKVGLKPNSSSEKLNLQSEEGSRGRTRLQGHPNSRATTRDFVAENKSNVVLNASKSSSSLLQNNPNKKNARLIKKKSSIEKTRQNSLNNIETNSKINTINHNHNNQQIHQNGLNNFNSKSEIYPSLEVGGPIARMNGTCGGFVPCFPVPHYNSSHFGNYTGSHYNGSNYQYFNNYSQFPQHNQTNYQRMNGYIGTNGFVDNNTPRCPYWCNLICRT